MIPHATHLKALADKDAIEEAIRREADPRGMISRDTIDTTGLVKYLKKRQRDNLNDYRTKQNSMQKEFDDKEERLHHIIRNQKKTMRSRYEEQQQTRDDHYDLQFAHNDLLEESKAKDERIKEFEEKVEATVDTCRRVTEGSVQAVAKAHTKMQRQIAHNQRKHGRELAELRGWNDTLQGRLDIARRLQPVTIFHRAQVGTVCEMHEKLVQFKKAKAEELAAVYKNTDDLRARIEYQEREIRDSKIVAEADREVFDKTANSLSVKRKALAEAEGKIKNHQREVERLTRWGKAWKHAFDVKEEELVALKSTMNTLKADQRMELIRVEAKSEGLQTLVDLLRQTNESMDKELETWENGHGGSLRVSEPKHGDAQRDGFAASLAKALKAANARADALQISFNALKAEKTFLETQLGKAENAYSPQIQEEVGRLQRDNRTLSEAAEKAALLETSLRGQFEEAERTREEQFANRTRELQSEFDQGFENVRELRVQWLSKQRSLEAQRTWEMEVKNHQLETAYQGRVDELGATWERRKEELQDNENDLASRETKLATAVKEFQSSHESITNAESRAKAAEKEVFDLQVAAKNKANYADLTERNLTTDIRSLIRDVQRHSDLLNEETSRTVEWSRLQDLYSEVKMANCSITSFKYHVTHVGTDSNALSQCLYGADFYESDVRLLQGEGRPVLLAQLQAARRTMERLRTLLAESPNVDLNKALWILTAPRFVLPWPILPLFKPVGSAKTLSRRSPAPLEGIVLT